MLERKEFRFQIKDFDAEAGTFVGYAAVFGNKDRQGEVIDGGAFSRTLDHHGGDVPLLWQHRLDEPMGMAHVVQDQRGLHLEGQLCLDTQRGQEARALMKMGALKGLSIGYDVVKDGWDSGARHLKEVRLWETSLVTIPANPSAAVVSVKSQEKARTMAEALADKRARQEVQERRWELMDVLSDCVTEILSDDEMDEAEKLSVLNTCMEQFVGETMGWAREAIRKGYKGFDEPLEIGDDHLDLEALDPVDDHSGEALEEVGDTKGTDPLEASVTEFRRLLGDLTQAAQAARNRK